MKLECQMPITSVTNTKAVMLQYKDRRTRNSDYSEYSSKSSISGSGAGSILLGGRTSVGSVMACTSDSANPPAFELIG
jgi:hypothetical protein